MTWGLRRLAPGEIDHELLWGSVAVAMTILAVALLAMTGVPALRCPFKAVTGLPCLTCGTTRLAGALLTGRLAEAIRYNPLVAALAGAVPPLTAYAWAVVVFRTRRVRCRVSPAGATLARAVAWLVLAANWLFLVLDGR